MSTILQVSTFYSDLGGVEKAVSDLVFGLKADNIVQILCTKHGAGTTLRTVDGVNVLSVGGRFSISGRPLAVDFPFELAKQQCDVVHYHLPFPLAMLGHITAKPNARISVATWHHDLVRHPTFNRVMRPLTERFLDQVDVIIATAPALIDQTPLLRDRRHKCRVVPLGIDDARFELTAESTTSDLRAKYGSAFVLFVGRLVYYKGCEILIDAISRIDADLVLVGEGPQRAELEKLAGDLNIQHRVHFLGRVSDSELASLYKACEVFVLPSTLPTECFGLVQVEAMLNGKPVINTNLPTGVPWVSIHGQTGLTVEPGDTDGLAGALSKLLSEDDLRRELGRNALTRAKSKFTLTQHVDAVNQVYREFLAAK